MSKKCLLALLGLSFVAGSGCAVPQPRGEGQYAHIQEPSTKAWYHLYIPVDYVKNNGRHPNSRYKRWPLVMTFHGMKPYDNALPQEREWEKQADIYGYIVCAPELQTSDSFMEYPLTKEHEYVLDDKRNVLAIMDHVFATTYADPKRVLSTSWSCGGYLAHYFPNRFPDRFGCIATRLSNFSSKLMAEETVPYYRDRVPVAVFIGDGDFPACKYESEEAVAWYTARGFRTIRGKMIDNMGHSRIPQTAAAFFAEHLNLEPLRPLEAAQTVALVQMTEYFPPPELIAKVAPTSGALLASAARPDSRPGSAAAPNTPPVVPPTTPKSQAASQGTQRPAPAFAALTAGRRYPLDRPPTYTSTPIPDSDTRAESRPTAPGATSAPPGASSQNRPGNWLEPAKDAPKLAEKPKPVSPAPPSSPVAAAPASNATQTPKIAASSNPGSKRPVSEAAASPIAESRTQPPFSPKSAGAKDYDRLMEARTQVGGYQSPAKAPAQPPPASVARSDSARGASKSQRGQALRANVRIGGPAIGTAPHYMRYSVDLPREKLDGADFLWMDNGVWIGDEPSGVKILDSPGLHFITVLVVTRDDSVYRGQAKVQVLERAPTAANYGSNVRPG
jgi:hypothetical protein